jgi:tetratricopeptide (TPR) repeat protein
MMTGVVHRRIVGCAIVAALACAGQEGAARASQSSGVQQQRWFELYDDAIVDVQARRYAQAEPKLLTAKKTGPPPGRSVLRVGSTRGPFFPDYYLGIVYQNTKRPQEALDAFARARRQDIDTTRAEFAPLDEFERLARADMPDPTKPGATPAWYTQYQEAIGHIRNREWAQAETKMLAAKEGGPQAGRNVLLDGAYRANFFPDYYLGVVYQNTSRFPEAVAAFQLARQQGAEGTLTDFGPVATLLADAEAEVAKLDTAATKKQFDGLLAAANQQFAQGNYAAGMSTVAQARALAPGYAASADALVQQIEAALVKGIEGDLAGYDRQAAALKYAGLMTVNPKSADAARLDKLINAAGADPPDRREMLRAVMRMYFQGNYAGASAALRTSDTASRDPAVAARFAFYHACSLAAQALSTTPTNAPLMSEARRHYKSALNDAGAFSQDRRYISPKILQELAR